MAYRRQLIADFLRAQREHADWPVVVSEGDSWFSFADAIGQLDDPLDRGDPKFQRAWALLRLEKAGDEVMTILSGAQRSLLRVIFEEYPLDALLFSGGGNDIIGADLQPLLRDFAAGAAAPDLVARSRFERRLRQIQDCYRELLDLLDDAGRTTKVFVNSYDYVRPSSRGAVYVGPFKVAGPWLQPAFEARKIPKALWGEVVKILIDGFCAAIDAVAAEPRGAGRLIRVETRGVVVDQWKDEIHPNRKGAMRVAKAFENALRAERVIT